MAQSYEAVGRTVLMMVNDTRHRWHQVLEQCGVTVAAVFVDDVDEETGESHRTLKQGGYMAAATIAIVPLKYRVLGVADALLTIDAATWATLDEDERLGLVDHELQHVMVRAAERGLVQLGDDGKIDRSARLDDHRRPVLKLRLHDWQLGGFRDVARRHKAAALEVQQVRAQLDTTTGQYAWDFAGARVEAGDEALDQLDPATCQRIMRSVVERLDPALADVLDAGEPCGAEPLDQLDPTTRRIVEAAVVCPDAVEMALDQLADQGVTSVTAHVDGESKTAELSASPLARRRAERAEAGGGGA